MDLRERRELNNGFGEALSRAFEFAVTPVVFGFLGHLIDMRTHTSPIFLLAFAAFAVTGMFVRLWYGYDRAMQAKDAGTPWGRSLAARAAAAHDAPPSAHEAPTTTDAGTGVATPRPRQSQSTSTGAGA